MTPAQTSLLGEIRKEFPLSEAKDGNLQIIGWILDEDDSPLMSTFQLDGKIVFDTDGFRHTTMSGEIFMHAMEKATRAIQLYQAWAATNGNGGHHVTG